MPAVLLLAPEDNCLIACRDLLAGETVNIGGCPMVLPEAIPSAFKLARLPLKVGDKVVRYGALIGSVTQPIACGALIHLHNLQSDYLPTYLSDGERSFVTYERAV